MARLSRPTIDRRGDRLLELIERERRLQRRAVLERLLTGWASVGEVEHRKRGLHFAQPSDQAGASLLDYRKVTDERVDANAAR